MNKHCQTCTCHTASSMSDEGIERLIENEGKRNRMYRDSGGAPTIGVGHLLTRSELRSGKIHIAGETVRWAAGLSDLQVTALLRQDIAKFEKAVRQNVGVPLNQHQFDALVSFAFNVGSQAFRKSTLLRRLNAGDYAAVPSQLKRWVYDNGKKVRGLVNRRNDEIAQWLG